MTILAENSQPKPRRRQVSYQYLLNTADQAGVCADLTTFFGPHADVYLDTYQKIRFDARTGHANPAGHGSWASIPWLVDWVLAIGRCMSTARCLSCFRLYWVTCSGPEGLCWQFCSRPRAKGLYVKYALERIAKVDKLGFTGTERADYLQRAGGASLTAGVSRRDCADACILTAVVFAVATRHHTHHS